MEDVRPRPVAREVPERSVPGQLVGAQKCRVLHAGGLADSPLDELVIRHPARPFGDHRQHHVAAVAVREALVGCEGGGVPVEHREIALGRVELVHGNRQHVVRDRPARILVEVVADSGAVREKMLDRHRVVDQRKVVAENRARRRRELERAILDQAHHRERRQPFRCACGREQRVDAVRDPGRPVGHPECRRELDLVASIDANGARERVLSRNLADEIVQALHPARVLASDPEALLPRCYTLARAAA